MVQPNLVPAQLFPAKLIPLLGAVGVLLGLALVGCGSSTPQGGTESGGFTGSAGATGSVGGATGATGGATGAGDAGVIDGGPAADGGASNFSFFVTSTGSGTAGGNLGGLAGADAKCQSLAAAVNQGGKTWHAYLSTSAPLVNARDRIGSGPWFNRNGTMIASGLAQLHDEAGMNLLSAANSLDERGTAVPTNQHDVLTGSTTAGMALPATPDRMCANWTSNTAGTAQVGHENRAGGGDIPTSWNSAHATPGCTQAMLVQVGGAGRLYCFAIN